MWSGCEPSEYLEPSSPTRESTAPASITACLPAGARARFDSAVVCRGSCQFGCEIWVQGWGRSPEFLGQQHEGEGDRHVGSTRYAVTAPSRRASSLARSRALQSISAPPSEMILDLWRGIPFLEKWAVERRICSQLSLTEGPERGLQPSKPRIDQGTHTVDAGDWMRPNAHPAYHVWRNGSNMAAASNMKWRLGLRKSCSEESCPFVEDE